VSQFSAVRTYVLTDTVECQEEICSLSIVSVHSAKIDSMSIGERIGVEYMDKRNVRCFIVLFYVRPRLKNDVSVYQFF
jgi:hypothetical protein